MKKVTLAVAAVAILAFSGFASATDIPHILRGSTHSFNPQVAKTSAWRMEITTPYNVRYNNLGACNAAKAGAENPTFNVMPISFSSGDGSWIQLVTFSNLKCDPIK